VIADAVGRDKLIRRFTREVKYQSALPAELFIPIVRADLDGERPSFLMPLAQANLREHILTTRRATQIPMEALLQILESLDWLHEHGFVHRDVKPENVLLHDGRWKLSDFGLILPPSEATERFTTVHGFFTELYCAPEQRRDFRNAGVPADIYSYGCILHDVWDGTARVPYQQCTTNGPMAVVIERCTEVDPKKRFKSIDGLRDALLTVHATPLGLETTPQAKEWVDNIAAGSVTQSDQLRDLCRFLQQTERGVAWPVFAALSEDALQAMHNVDGDRWAELAAVYCEWAHGGFDFDYCDVVVRRLVSIFMLGSIGTKAAAALAAAELGRSHNRWFVMWRVVEMCGKGLDDRVAERIAVEILASEAQTNFRACADVIGNSIDVYHPKIATLL
jgi:eukaryotic-like serine/threonine-protein kinase